MTSPPIALLGEVTNLLSGFAFDSSGFSSDGEIPVVRIRDIVRGYSTTFYTGSYEAKFKVQNGDLLIGMDGEFNCARWTGGKALLNQRVCKIEPADDCLNPRYLRHYLPQALKVIEEATPFVTVKHLSTNAIRSICIPLPPLPQQLQIAEVIDRSEALQAKRRTALDHLNTLIQSIFLDMFGDPGTNPMEWPLKEIAGLCASVNDIRCGPFGTQLNKSAFRGDGVPLWGIKHVNRSFETPTTVFLDASTASRLSMYSLEPKDIVMTRKGTVGNCAVYPAQAPLGIMHSDLLRIRLDQRICDPDFLSHQLQHSSSVARQLVAMSGGAVMPGINVGRLKALKVLVPPLHLQVRFAASLASINALRTLHRHGLEKLDTLFASLQHRAFRGEL